MIKKNMLYVTALLCSIYSGYTLADATKKSFEENHIVSVNVNEKYEFSPPQISFPSSPVTGVNGDQLFSVDVVIPERVSKIRIYPLSAPDTGIGSMANVEDRSNIIKYKIVDSKDRLMKRDEAGIDVSRGKPETFRAISTNNNTKSVSGGLFEDYLKIDYYVN